MSQPRFIEDLLKEALTTLDLAKRINLDADRKLLQAQALKDEAVEIFNTGISIQRRTRRMNFGALIFGVITLVLSISQILKK